MSNNLRPISRKRLISVAKLLKKRSIKCLNKNSAKMQNAVVNNSAKKSEEEQPCESVEEEMEKSYTAHDKAMTNFVDNTMNSKEEIEVDNVVSQLLSEIQTLDNLLKEKESEWNKLLHMRSVKQELLNRIQRKKIVKFYNSKVMDDLVDEEVMKGYEECGDNVKDLWKKDCNGIGTIGLGRQGPIIDVKSIIADYRQNHPDVVPRRGRRMKSASRLGKSEETLPSRISPNPANSTLFKDVLMDMSHDSSITSKIAQQLQHPHPEVSLHPVQTTAHPQQSLLQATLKKGMQPSANCSPVSINNTNKFEMDSKPTFSPTLAKLLTAPKRNSPLHHQNGPLSLSPHHQAAVSLKNACNPTNLGNVSIADLLSQQKEDAIQDHDDSIDRLVIDEDNVSVEQETAFGTSEGASIKCQGCNQKPAKFVCAGCGNQWYCSRECQINAWDEHSDVCSG